jgi:hypothetical protein
MPSNNPKYAPAGVGPTAVGIGDIEIGVKYRYIKETKHRPMIGTFAMIEVPTGNYKLGLGVAKVWWKLPVWVQKSFGPWTTYGGVGEQMVPHTNYNNFTYGGWLLERDIGKKWTLGGEVFSHGAEGIATAANQRVDAWSTWAATTTKIPAFRSCFPIGTQSVA